MANGAGCEGVAEHERLIPFHPRDKPSRLSASYTEGSRRQRICQSRKPCPEHPSVFFSRHVVQLYRDKTYRKTTRIKPGYGVPPRWVCSALGQVFRRVLTSRPRAGPTPSSFSPRITSIPHQRGGPYHLDRPDPLPDKSDSACIQRPTLLPPLLPMADNAPLGAGVHPEPPHTTVTSTVHRPFRPRSQITILDVDLASALSVAPAPHSWKVAEQRVMSEFGGSFPGPASPDADPPAPHKAYFVGDSKCVLIWV